MGRLIITFLAAIILLPGCKEDKSTFELVFKATYDGEPLVMFDDLDYKDDYKIRITQSDFYITDVKLINGDSELPLSEVEFVDFSSFNINAEKALEGFTVSYDELDPADYNQLQFSIGVQPEENVMKPADFSSNNPLSKAGYYWDAWDSYIFAKLQGTFEETPGNFDASWFFHTGKDELLRTFTIDTNISLGADETSSVTISMDHKSLLENQDGSLFDIQSNPTNHDPSDIGPIQMIADNYLNAMTFQ